MQTNLVMAVHRKLRQEDHELKVSLDYRARTCLKQQQKQNQRNKVSRKHVLSRIGRNLNPCTLLVRIRNVATITIENELVVPQKVKDHPMAC